MIWDLYRCAAILVLIFFIGIVLMHAPPNTTQEERIIRLERNLGGVFIAIGILLLYLCFTLKLVIDKLGGGEWLINS